MYEARKICNYLIARYGERSSDLSNARLNKLLYFIHGWALTSRPQGLVRNHFFAWKFGPIVRPVYDAFKSYGEKRITTLANYLDYASGQMATIAYDDIAAEDADLIDRVYENYRPYTTGQLIDISHQSGGPWDVVYSAWLNDNRLSTRIPNELIKSHFQTAGGKVRH
jgi:uncharacterized phage-associated protein